MTTTVEHFKISGDFVTQHARERVGDRGWEDALRFLLESLHGMDYDVAVGICSGKLRLTGVNDLKVAPEKPGRRAKVIQRQNWLFAGTVFDGQHYFRPYAYVDNWGYYDVLQPARCENLYVPWRYGQAIAKNKDARCVHYMEDARYDRVEWLKYQGDTTAVLWERVDPVPIWVRRYNHLTWQAALDEYLTIGRKTLDHRGHAQYYKNTPPPYGETEEATDTAVPQQPATKNSPPPPNLDKDFKCDHG